MSGTSLDGIDVSLVRTNGITLQKRNNNFFYKYSAEISSKLNKDLVNYKDILLNHKKKNKLETFITKLHIKAVKESKFLKYADVIGFHGQTLYHNPEKKVSIQLGLSDLLCKFLKKNIVYDFRKIDLDNGGEGAPLAPIYHKSIIDDLNLDLPSCFLNIGGIANITFWDGVNLIGFDTGPGNGLMDQYMKLKFDRNFDENGYIASLGNINHEFVKAFLSNPFFSRSFPKSLDKNFFKKEERKFNSSTLGNNDLMASLLEITAMTIKKSLEMLPKFPKNIIVSGGGFKNKYLMERLKNLIKANFINIEKYGYNCDFIESELIAYLAARSLYNLPITFPKTTGVKNPMTGGILKKM